MKYMLTPRAEKSLRGINQPDKKRIIRALERLPLGDIKALQGYTNMFRLRVGDWRILFSYRTNDAILVERIAPRGDIYKGGF